MKNPFKIHFMSCLIITACLTMTTIGCKKEEQKVVVPEPTSDELLIMANRVDSAFLAAFNKGDVNELMQLYWNDPTLISYPPAGNMQINGYAALQDFYNKEFAANKGATLKYTNTYNAVFKDVVVGHGTFQWIMPMDSSTIPQVFEGRYTEVKAMKDGKMLITVDHTSAPMPIEVPADTTAVAPEVK